MNNFFDILTISHQVVASKLQNSYKKQRLFLIQISFHFVLPNERTLLKFESCRLVGNGRIFHDNRRINMHVLFHILEYENKKTVFENFIRKRFVGTLSDFM